MIPSYSSISAVRLYRHLFAIPLRCRYRQILLYNTAIPFSVVVERLFSIGKEILKSKRAGFTDLHFEMLVFLKGNKRRFACILHLFCLYTLGELKVFWFY